MTRRAGRIRRARLGAAVRDTRSRRLLWAESSRKPLDGLKLIFGPEVLEAIDSCNQLATQSVS